MARKQVTLNKNDRGTGLYVRNDANKQTKKPAKPKKKA